MNKIQKINHNKKKYRTRQNLTKFRPLELLKMTQIRKKTELRLKILLSKKRKRILLLSKNRNSWEEPTQ
jgi:hypothetical protein